MGGHSPFAARRSHIVETPAGALRLASDALGVERGRACVVHAASPAVRLACIAASAAVKNEDVARVIPLGPWEKGAEVYLDLRRVVVRGPAEALTQALNVRVDYDALGNVPKDAEDYVRSFAAHAGQRQELSHSRRHFTAMVCDESARQPDDRFGLCAKESQCRYEWLDLCGLCGGQGRGVREPCKELRCGLVYADVGRLRRENDRHNEFERRAIIQFAVGTGVLLRQAVERLERQVRCALAAFASLFGRDGPDRDRTQLSSLGGGNVSPFTGGTMDPPPTSASFASASLSTATMRSPSPSVISFTPCALRPVSRI
jgi:hypothetical protein